jgi:hypothetical protein
MLFFHHHRQGDGLPTSVFNFCGKRLQFALNAGRRSLAP